MTASRRSGPSVRSRNVRVAAGTTGLVYTIRRLLGGASTLSLTASGHANLSLDGDGIEATAPLGEGVTQKAIVREVLGDEAIEYAVNITGAPVLSALTISPDTVTFGAESTIEILGATAGSTISGNLPAGLSINSGAREITGLAEEAGTLAISLLETLPGAVNSPRRSDLALTVLPAAERPSIAFSPTLTGLRVDWTDGPLNEHDVIERTVFLRKVGTGAYADHIFVAGEVDPPFAIGGLDQGADYEGYGVALTTGGLTAPSEIADARTWGRPPAPMFTASGGVQSFVAAWTDAEGGAPILHHRLFMGATAGSLAHIGDILTDSPYEDALDPGTYYLALSTVNALGLESDLSEIVEIEVLEDSLPPPVGDGMELGLGLGGIRNWLNPKPFINLLLHAGSSWSPENSLTVSPYTQSRGELSPSNPEDEFSFTVIAPVTNGVGYSKGVPAGQITLYNPDNNWFKVYFSGNQTAWSTATWITFEHDGIGGVFLKNKGGVTKVNGKPAMFRSALLENFQNGEVWDPQFLAFVAGTGARRLRFMDWLRTNETTISQWSQRSLPSDIFFAQAMVPYEYCFDLCNRLQMFCWLNIPHRATDDFIDQLATLARDQLDPALQLGPENNNETWGTGSAFLSRHIWFEYYTHTRLTAQRVGSENRMFRPAHGMTTGERVAILDGLAYPLSSGGGIMEVDVIDADHFRFRRAGGGSVYAMPAEARANDTAMFVMVDEPGKIIGYKYHHANQSLNIWNRFDAIMGRERVVHILGSWIANKSETQAYFNVPGVRDACDEVAVANYIQTMAWDVRMRLSPGQIIPGAWYGHPAGGSSSIDVPFCVFAAGSDFSIEDVLAGTGDGFLAQRIITIPNRESDSYAEAPAITGLADGTYEVAAVMQGLWLARSTISVGGTETVYMAESDDDWYVRLADNNRNNCRSKIFEIHKLCTPFGIKVVGYEDNYDFNWKKYPSQRMNARAGQFAHSEAGLRLFHELKYEQAPYLSSACHFVDVGAVRGRFDLADSYFATDDPRYQAFCAMDGLAAMHVPVSVPTRIDLPDLPVEPATSTKIGDLPDPLLDYRITGGNNDGAFSVGEDGIYVDPARVSAGWGEMVTRTISYQAWDSYTSDSGTLRIRLGGGASLWYPGAAEWVWDPSLSEDTAAIASLVGGPLALAGTPFTYDPATGMWTASGTGRYQNLDTATARPIYKTDPLLVAMILDKHVHNASSTRTIARFGNVTNGVIFERTGSNQMRARWVDTSGTINGVSGGFDVAMRCHDAMPAGAEVYWAFRDAEGRPHAGHGTEAVNHVAGNLYVGGTGSFPREVRIGGVSSGESNMKHGKAIIVAKPGMDLAEALSFVAALKAAHDAWEPAA
ncbi:hypothetical protein [Sphingobium lignivorans]|nr:hypothetical protein [Sphingobium lignivorans]